MTLAEELAAKWLDRDMPFTSTVNAINEALERAAQECDKRAETSKWGTGEEMTLQACAEAIRALKSPARTPHAGPRLYDHRPDKSRRGYKRSDITTSVSWACSSGKHWLCTRNQCACQRCIDCGRHEKARSEETRLVREGDGCEGRHILLRNVKPWRV